MALVYTYVINYGKLSDIFQKLKEGQAPDQFTHQHLKDLGYISSNYRAVIPLLKSLGFLDPDGRPTSIYHDYRNESQSRHVMAEAIRRAYGDIFVLKAKPTQSDNAIIQGKFKSVHNVSNNVAKLMANTFFALMELADMDTYASERPMSSEPTVKEETTKEPVKTTESASRVTGKIHSTLHYNIQIHLPATKDVEVYNAIFKSLKEHILD